jgi:hypothetical protein
MDKGGEAVTPQEAVDQLIAERLLKWRAPQAFALKLFEAVAAKATADETQRCAALVKESLQMWSHDATFANVLKSLLLNIRSGGLEVEV